MIKFHLLNLKLLRLRRSFASDLLEKWQSELFVCLCVRVIARFHQVFHTSRDGDRDAVGESEFSTSQKKGLWKRLVYEYRKVRI